MNERGKDTEERESLDRLQEMASISGVRNYKIGVFGGEGGNPHFHVWKGNDDPEQPLA
jgi:hypothetical protein